MIWKGREKYLFLTDFKPDEKTPVASYQIHTNCPLSVFPRLVKGVFVYASYLLYCVYPADGVNCAIPNQNTPNGYYNIERMLKLSTNNGAKLLLCGSCLEARGLKEIVLVEKALISSMSELTNEIMTSDKLLTF